MISLRALDSAMPPNRKIENVERAIYLIRGRRIMLDSDLAAIYQVTTKRLNQQFTRNRKRFPVDFAFQLAAEEFTNLKSQIATSNRRGGRRYLPWVFTEHGAIMLASVLNSDVAVQASVRVVRAFIKLREMVAANAQLASKLEELARRLDSPDEATPKAFASPDYFGVVDLFATLKRLLEPEAKPKREIGFHVRERSARYRTKRRF
ncbi:MAG TPA: ORF6N domain-containing protein [Chthoniobacterales bacterium]|nr:ORF6N domain-containing protein [Chthoniobacterales bacterium]